jgi:hypothetical protein
LVEVTSSQVEPTSSDRCAGCDDFVAEWWVTGGLPPLVACRGCIRRVWRARWHVILAWLSIWLVVMVATSVPDRYGRLESLLAFVLGGAWMVWSAPPGTRRLIERVREGSRAHPHDLPEMRRRTILGNTLRIAGCVGVAMVVLEHAWSGRSERWWRVAEATESLIGGDELAFSPDGDAVFALGIRPQVLTWRPGETPDAGGVRGLSPVRKLAHAGGTILPGAEHAVLFERGADEEAILHLVSLPELREEAILRTGQRLPVLVGIDGTRGELLSASEDGVLRWWTLDPPGGAAMADSPGTPALARELRIDPFEVGRSTLSPACTRLLSGGVPDGEGLTSPVLWDTRSGEPVAICEGDQARGRGAIAPGGRYFAFPVPGREPPALFDGVGKRIELQIDRYYIPPPVGFGEDGDVLVLSTGYYSLHVSCSTGEVLETLHQAYPAGRARVVSEDGSRVALVDVHDLVLYRSAPPAYRKLGLLASWHAWVMIAVAVILHVIAHRLLRPRPLDGAG